VSNQQSHTSLHLPYGVPRLRDNLLDTAHCLRIRAQDRACVVEHALCRVCLSEGEVFWDVFVAMVADGVSL